MRRDYIFNILIIFLFCFVLCLMLPTDYYEKNLTITADKDFLLLLLILLVVLLVFLDSFIHFFGHKNETSLILKNSIKMKHYFFVHKLGGCQSLLSLSLKALTFLHIIYYDAGNWKHFCCSVIFEARKILICSFVFHLIFHSVWCEK